LKLSFFLVHVLNESSPALLHLIESSLQSSPIRRLIALAMFDFLLLDSILGMPNIMRDELLDRTFPILPEIVVLQWLDFINQPVDVLNQNIVSSNENPLLVLNGACISCTDLICASDRLLGL